MTRISRLLALFAGCLTAALVLGVAADGISQEKKGEKKVDKKDEKKTDKKDEKKTDKKDDKKEDKKIVEEKKPEPFKPDVPQAEIKAHVNDKGGYDWINALSVSGDGKLLATASRDRTVKVFDLAAKKEIATLKGSPNNVKTVLFLGDKVVSTTGAWNKEKKTWEGEISVWDSKSGKKERVIKGHGDEIEGAALSKDGKILITASEDQTAKLWDIGSGKEGLTLKGHTKELTAVAITADGKKAATASKDGTVKLWDAAAGKDMATFKVEKMVKSPPDPKTKKETETKVTSREFVALAFSPDGKRLAAANLEGQIKIYDADANKEIREIKAPDGVWSLSFSPDGTKLASGGWDQTITIWNAATGASLHSIKAHPGNVTALAFTSDGERIISGGLDGLVKIWSASKK